MLLLMRDNVIGGQRAVGVLVLLEEAMMMNHRGIGLHFYVGIILIRVGRELALLLLRIKGSVRK